MKRLLSLVAFFATLHASAQQVNPVPDYVFRNQMSVGRGTVTDTAAYFSIGPRYGANKGFMPPIVGDTATFSSGKRNGLLIFSVQKNKFLYWDSVRVQWSDMAGSSGTYITGTGITGYVPQFNGTTTIDTSALFTLGSRLGIGTTSFAYNSTSTANVELNGTAGGIVGFKRNDSARGYLWHTGSDMELANTTAGTLSFNTNSATRGSISSAGVWRLHNLAGTGDRVVVASSNGTLSASTSVTGLVDTLTLSTRAWRQKGLDSLAALEVSGSGTTNYLPKFTAASTIGNSQIFDNGTNVGIGTTSPAEKFSVNGIGAFSTRLKFNGFNQLVGDGNQFQNGDGIAGFGIRNDSGQVMLAAGSSTPQFRLLKNGRILINTTTDAGYQFDVNGTLRSVNGANFATTSGNVGIGTASPLNKLHVEFSDATAYSPSNTLTAAPIAYFYNNTSADAAVATTIRLDAGNLTGNNAVSLSAVRTGNADAAMTFGTRSGGGSVTERARITSSGELLINTTTDAGDYKLQVAGNVYATGELTLTGTGSVFTRNTANTSGFDIGLLGGSSVADAYVYQRHSADLIFGTANIARMRLSAGGNFGVGTSTPVFRFNAVKSGTSSVDIVAQVALDNGVGGYGAALAFSSEGNNNGTHKVGIGNVRTGGWDVSDLVFYANNTVAQGDFTASDERMRLKSDGEFFINTTTDAGDYKLQVVGNARVGTGKLDIASNTTYGLGIARSGTSEVAGQIYNSSGILYTGVEGSAGGAIFTGSSAYAAVIGSGANYPLQFATNNVTRATINTNGELLINTLSDQGDYKLQVNGSVYNTGQVTRGVINAQGTGAQISTDSTTNLSPLYLAGQSLTGSSTQALIYGNATWNTSGIPSLIDINLTNTASSSDANYIKITDGTNLFRVTKDAGIITAAPSGGTASKWKLGSVVGGSVTLNSGQYIEVEVAGATYRLAVVTLN